jgi:transposase
MKRPRRSFSTEFKHDAARLVLDQGYSVIEVSRSLNVGETALRRWVSQLELERGGVTSSSKALTPDQQRI